MSVVLSLKHYLNTRCARRAAFARCALPRAGQVIPADVSRRTPRKVTRSCKMPTVREVLNRKGRHVYCIDPDATVLTALRIMAEHDIGALVVLDSGNLVGIITERDYAQKIVLKGRTSPKTAVREIMSTRVICV